jgi:HD-like signal output (HDOD) protein
MSEVIKTCNTCQRAYANENDFLSKTSRWRCCSLGHLWFNCSCGSTLIIKSGKFDWFSPDKFMSPEAASVFNKLGGLKDLPFLPNRVLELQSLVGQEDVEIEQLAVAVREEPLIAASILQMAENLRYARNPDAPEIVSLNHAIVYIGRGALTDILSAAAIRKFELPASEFDQALFWQESYLTGAIAESLSAAIKTNIQKDKAYLAGTMVNIGKLVVAISFPALATKISCDLVDVKKLSTWRKIEDTYKFPNHAILGEIASSIWGLPDFISSVIRFHHDKPNLESAGSQQQLNSLVGLANQLSHWILGQPHRIDNDLLNSYRGFFNISEDDLEAAVQKLLPLRDKIKYK